MGILNVTPDSFSDGGQHPSLNAALDHALKMTAQGAEVIDIGGESTRPGADAVPLEMELERVIPVVKALHQSDRFQRSGALISVDTSKSEVADAALAAGAKWVNDIKAGQDPAMVGVVKDHGAHVVLMHMQGDPTNMQSDPCYDDVVEDVKSFLLDRAQAFIDQGVPPTQIILDPGIGFGKTLDHNLKLLKALPDFCQGDHELLVGASRKSFIGQLNDAPVDERLPGSLAVALSCAQAGVAWCRVHDVAQTKQALRTQEALQSV